MPNAGPRPSSVHPQDLAALAARLGVGVSRPRPSGTEVTEVTEVTGLELDSRLVRPGDLYAALPGARTHGAQFAGQAARLGAAAVLTDPDGAGTAAAQAPDLPQLVVPAPREVLGELAVLVYPRPERTPQTVGITGTNGKTTTAFLLDAVLADVGMATGMIGTVETRIKRQRVPSVRTTPEAPALHALLATMAERGVQVATLEVSSHALALHRVDGLVVDVAGFTNLSHDHLDFHPSMEDYFAAKAQLFTPARSRRAVVCVDDGWGQRLAEQAQVPVTTLSSRPDVPADWQVSCRTQDATGSDAVLRPPDGGPAVPLRCPLPGRFNVTNTALAVVLAVQLGVPLGRATGAVATAPGVPGRMQRVPGPGADGEPVGIVDYAHTPDAVAAAVAALLPAAGRPLVVVLGAGGDRDRDKRPEMGAAGARGDVLVVTDDNPRSEDPARIRSAVLAGAAQAGGARLLEIPARSAAIRRAVQLAWGGGTVLVLGKGHEQGQEVDGVVHPFDDRQVLAAALSAGGTEPDEENAP